MNQLQKEIYAQEMAINNAADLSKDQLELLEHIKAQNARWSAWQAEDPKNRSNIALITIDMPFWAKVNIYSITDFNRSVDAEKEKESRKVSY